MIPLYHESRVLRKAVERLLAWDQLVPTASRLEFAALLVGADVGIIAIRRCSATDVKWIRRLSHRRLLAPSCIVITPLSIERLQQLRGIESERIHVVWAEEVDDLLVDVLTEMAPWHDDPLRLLGQRILADASPHRSVVSAIQRTCNLSVDHWPSPPETSVIELASSVGLSADSFRRYWREGLPLTCGPKQLLNWAVLLWALRQRPRVKWDALARQAGIGRRTLERHGRQLADCTLAEAARDPKLLKRRFREWAGSVSRVTTEVAPTRDGLA